MWVEGKAIKEWIKRKVRRDGENKGREKEMKKIGEKRSSGR